MTNNYGWGRLASMVHTGEDNKKTVFKVYQIFLENFIEQ